LAVFLSGLFSQEALQASRELGSYFETMIFLHLRTLTGLMTPQAHLYFWRTQDGAEVDFVVEHGRSVVAIEVKMTDQPSYRHTEGLRKFLKAHPSAQGGLLLHNGAAIKRLDERIAAIPWTMLTG
jgi:predicted AAA+ superfamily ATPase